MLTFSGVRIGEERRNVLRGEGSNWRSGSIVRTPFSCQEYFWIFFAFAHFSNNRYAHLSPVPSYSLARFFRAPTSFSRSSYRFERTEKISLHVPYSPPKALTTRTEFLSPRNPADLPRAATPASPARASKIPSWVSGISNCEPFVCEPLSWVPLERIRTNCCRLSTSILPPAPQEFFPFADLRPPPPLA